MDNSDEIACKVEFQYDLRAIESEAKGLFYLTDDKRKSIGILTCRHGNKSICVLNKNQVKALLEDLGAIWDFYMEGK